MSAVSFSDYFVVIFHYSFLKVASVIYYLLKHNNPPLVGGEIIGGPFPAFLGKFHVFPAFRSFISFFPAFRHFSLCFGCFLVLRSFSRQLSGFRSFHN